MARGRMLDQRIAKSDKLAAVRFEKARVLYFMIYPHLDVDGRYSGDPQDIKEDCVPRLKGYSEVEIVKGLQELTRVGLIHFYEAGGQPCVEFTRFEDFQALRREREAPSRFPAYSGSTPEYSWRTTALSLSLSIKLSKEKIIPSPLLFPPPNRDRPIIFNFVEKRFEDILEADKAEWRKAYPACDIELCILQAGAWLVRNPEKVKSDFARFLVNWLKREQDRGGATKQGRLPGRGPARLTREEQIAESQKETRRLLDEKQKEEHLVKR